MKLPLIGISGRGRSYTQNHRRALNVIVESDDAGGKGKLTWLGRPGLLAFGTPSALVRGEPIVFGDYFYYVAGKDLYRMDSAGTESSSLGTLTTNSGYNISMTKNRTQIMIADGTQALYVYYVTATNGVAAATFKKVTSFSLQYLISGITQIGSTTSYTATTTASHTGAIGEEVLIYGTTNFNGLHTITDVTPATTFDFVNDNDTDADETGLSTAYAEIRTDALTISPSHVDHMNGYGLINNTRTNTDDGVHPGQFYPTQADDFTNIDVTDYAVAQRNPDDLKTLYALGGDLQLFGTESLEHYYYAGAVDSPWQPTRAAATPWGIAAPWTVATAGDGLAWVAQRANGGLTVCTMEGYLPTEIASHAVAYRLAQATTAQITAATAFSYRQEAHDLYVLTFASETWVYDSTESKKVGQPVWTEWGTGSSKFLGKWYVYAFGKHLVSDHTASAIYEMNLGTYLDGSTAIKRLGVSGYVHADDKGVTHNRVCVLLEKGCTLLLESSDDAGVTWQSHGQRTGRKQEWHAPGFAETDRLYRITTSTADAFVVTDAYVDLEKADH